MFPTILGPGILNVPLESRAIMPPKVNVPRSASFEHIEAVKDTNVEYVELPRKLLTADS